MELGVCVASQITDVDYVVEAEQLGFTHAWLADSQMIWSDAYATLAVAAERTSTIQLGTGVAVAATRPAPVTAASIATINALAPGRTFMGIGTGNTAMRIMGYKPMRIAEFDDYLATLAPLLRGEDATFTWRGETRTLRHLMPDHGFVNLEDPIPLYVSGFGPRSLGLAGKYGDGVITSVPPVAPMMDWLWAPVERGAAEVGKTIDRDNYLSASLSTIVITEPGEPLSSQRVRDQCGAFAIAGLHYTYDQWRNFGKEPNNPAIQDIWDDYTAMLDKIPADELHLRIHQGHNCWVIPEEERFVTPELIQASCLVGTPDEIVERLVALDAAGLSQLMLLPPLEPRYDVLREVAEKILPALV